MCVTRSWLLSTGKIFLTVLDNGPKQTSLGQEERKDPGGPVQGLPLELRAFGQIINLSGFALPGTLAPCTPNSLVPQGLLCISWKQKPVLFVNWGELFGVQEEYGQILQKVWSELLTLNGFILLHA